MRLDRPPPAPGASRRGAAAPPPLVLLYVAFALLSTAVNLGTQAIVGTALAGWAGAALPAAMACGTGAGFTSKYLLDKNFIFFDRSAGLRDEARKVGLSGLFSLGTTLLFWGCEIAAWHIGGTAGAKYAGAVFGIALGYGVKFLLDRRFTFTGTGPRRDCRPTNAARAGDRRATRPAAPAWPAWFHSAGR